MTILNFKTLIILFGITSWATSFSESKLMNPKHDFLKKECKDEFSKKVEFRVCSINKIIGIAQLLPHKAILDKVPGSKKHIDKCVKDLNLRSRQRNYNLAIACLRRAHKKQLNQKTKKDFLKSELDKFSAEKIAQIGELFFYGGKVKQDINFAAQLLVSASNKGDKKAANKLMLMLHYINSNKIEIPQKTKLEIFEVVSNNYVMNKKNESANKAYRKARKAERKDDFKGANKWYAIAVKQNHSGATNNLGVNYAKGKGVERNMPKAIELYTKAAKLGSEYAQQTLGNRYVNGRGVEKDINKGIKYYEQSISQGHVKAAYELAELYRKGKKVKQDNKKAYENYMSATKGSMVFVYKKEVAKAASWIGYFHEKGTAVKKDKKLAFNWYEKAALLGNKYGQKQLGVFYQSGKGVNKNYCKALEWYQKAAEHKDKFSERKIGYFYRNGWCEDKDFIKSFYWFEKAAKQGDSNAMYQLANQHWIGQGVTMDKKKASQWYHKSAKLNYSSAQYWLGEIYARGEFVNRDLNKACEWTLKASKNGHKSAKFNHEKFCQ